jgi:hypothetical protein
VLFNRLFYVGLSMKNWKRLPNLVQTRIVVIVTIAVAEAVTIAAGSVPSG